MIYKVLRPLLFRLEPELAHEFVLRALNHLPAWCFPKVHGEAVDAMGLRFPHAFGLAAGFDKKGTALKGLVKLGFAFMEVGTVTPRPQRGNPLPRLFRLPKENAIINRMGFNNEGVDALLLHLEKSPYCGILGINIGKNKDTALHDAVQDYLHCFSKVYQRASYITINVSSPNTPDLRLLQQDDFFPDLLKALTKERQDLAECYQRHVPLVVKVSPDEDDETLKRMASSMLKYGIEGIIATNTTRERAAVLGLPHAEEEGGLSGAPLFARSTQCLRLLKQEVGTAITLIGSGGIDSPQAAQEKLQAGASLLQLYTGLIYRGPGLVSSLVKKTGKPS
jgi:dihydroorotate dehydrogenase